MSKHLKTGQLHKTLKHWEKESETDKLFEELGLPAIKRETILHFYLLFFIVETSSDFMFYSTTKNLLFTHPKTKISGVIDAPVIPKELLDIFSLFTIKFERPFTPYFRKVNYKTSRKRWMPVDTEFPEASPNNPLTITYYDADKKYSLGPLFIYRQVNEQTETLDLREIDVDFLEELFLMEVVYFPLKDFTQSPVFFDFYLKLFSKILNNSQ